MSEQRRAQFDAYWNRLRAKAKTVRGHPAEDPTTCGKGQYLQYALARNVSLDYGVGDTFWQVCVYFETNTPDVNYRLRDELLAKLAPVQDEFVRQLVPRDQGARAGLHFRRDVPAISSDWDVLSDEMIEAMVQLDGAVRHHILELLGESDAC